jgi:23S rRNA (guanosine2251-2'-O)-methyltransferase
MPRPRPKTRRSSPRDPATASTQWLTGLHPVREALRAGRRRLDCLWLREGHPRPEQLELVELARKAGVEIEEVSASKLEQRAEGDSNPQGVALRVGPLPELTLADLLDRAAEVGPGSRLLVLDGVEDPQNVGAVVRVAESAGVRGLILTHRRSPPLSPAVSRASAGAIEWLRVARVSNLGRALGELQERGYWVLAAAPSVGGTTLHEMEDRLLTGDLAVVLGAEGRGIRPSILEQADHRVGIPMRGEVASLNVSTAGAVILYDLLRRAESDGVRPGGASEES